METRQGFPVCPVNAVADAEVSGLIPMELSRKWNAFPLARDEVGRIQLVMENPLDIDRIGEIQAYIGASVLPMQGTLAQIDYLRNSAVRRGDSGRAYHRGKDGAGPVERLVDSIIAGAIQAGASDIHFEPFERELVVRIRQDGVMKVVRKLSYRLAPELISRIKVMASIDIAEKRRPQDGGIRFESAGRTWDLRVSVLPTEYGQKIVLRILDRGSVALDLDSLGMSEKLQKILQSQIERPHGLILVTGPTGSGKTTTLYTILSGIKSPELNICTVEDPVEYRLDGIAQTAVNAKIGLTFSTALRTLLRQDPDVILVGEIRDAETAELAIRAALTGHLVLSTLHTNDASTAVARLLDMGIEPFLLGSCLELVIAQRLVRRVCPECKVHKAPGQVCPRCSGAGYDGRVGLFEFLGFEDETRAIIQRRGSAGELRNAARAKGWVSMREDGMEKVKLGLTTELEVARETLA